MISTSIAPNALAVMSDGIHFALIEYVPDGEWRGKPGITLGENDEFGFNVIRDKVHVLDLHAMALHLLGFNHLRLIHRFQDRDFRLTDVHGEVVEALLA